MTFVVEYSYYATQRPINPPPDGVGYRAPTGEKYMYLSYSALNHGSTSTIFGFGKLSDYSLTVAFNDGSTLSPEFGVDVLPPGIPLAAGETRLISESQQVTGITVFSHKLGKNIADIVFGAAKIVLDATSDMIPPVRAPPVCLDDPMTSNPNPNWDTSDFWGSPPPPPATVDSTGTTFHSGGNYNGGAGNGGVWETWASCRMDLNTDEFDTNLQVTRTYTGAKQEMVAFMSSVKRATNTDAEFGWTFRGPSCPPYSPPCNFFYKQDCGGAFDWRQTLVDISVTHQYKIIHRIDATGNWLDAYVDGVYQNTRPFPTSGTGCGNTNFYTTVGWNAGTDTSVPIPTDSTEKVSHVTIYEG